MVLVDLSLVLLDGRADWPVRDRNALDSFKTVAGIDNHGDGDDAAKSH